MALSNGVLREPFFFLLVSLNLRIFLHGSRMY